MSDPADIQRLIGDGLRLGLVESVDHEAATARVRFGDLVTTDLPLACARAGTVRIWMPPVVGEQVLVACPEGDTNAGIVLASLFSTKRPAPDAGAALALIAFDDGARLSYDQAAHGLVADLPGGATVRIRADAGVRIEGPVEIVGALKVSETIAAGDDVTARGDVKAGAVSLKGHIHDKVQAGTAVSGKPVGV